MEYQESKADIRKRMEVYKQLATPGGPHKLLAGLAGSWDIKEKSWMEPGQPPAESSGTCERKMILGGRYLKEEFSGDMMGTPVNGIGFTGYNNFTNKYVSAWMDSMGTGIYCFEGSAGQDGKTITMENRAEDPVRGPMQWRSVIRIVDADTQIFEMKGTDKDGKTEKMEMTYTRQPEELRLERVLDASRNCVFKAWTDCEHLLRWFAPENFSTPSCRIDLKPGGVFHYCMRSPEGRDFWGKGVYREIVEPEKIVYSDSFADEKGNAVPASRYGMSPDWPMETTVTVTFEEIEGKTKLTLKHALPHVAAMEREQCRQGWDQTLDKLEKELAKAYAAH